MPKNQIIWFSISWDSSMGCKQAKKKLAEYRGFAPNPFDCRVRVWWETGWRAPGSGAMWGALIQDDERTMSKIDQNMTLSAQKYQKNCLKMWFWSIFQINATHYCKRSRAKLSNGMLIPFLAPKLASPDLVTFDKAEIGSSTGAIGVKLLTA